MSYTVEGEKAYLDAAKGFRIEKNQEIIIQAQDSCYAYFFAKNVKGVDLERLQQVIIDNQDIRYAYYFALNIKEANIQKLSEVVFNSGDKRYIKEFYKNIPHDKFDVTRFETYLTFM